MTNKLVHALDATACEWGCRSLATCMASFSVEISPYLMVLKASKRTFAGDARGWRCIEVPFSFLFFLLLLLFFPISPGCHVILFICQIWSSVFLLLLILFWILFIFFISSIDIRLIEIGFRDFSQFFYEIISFLWPESQVWKVGSSWLQFFLWSHLNFFFYNWIV